MIAPGVPSVPVDAPASTSGAESDSDDLRRVRPAAVLEPSPQAGLSKWGRRAITAWLLFHLTAVISAPASVAPASDLARATWSLCRPYLQVLYLNHGYHFFAPDPGESTLLAYTVETRDGQTRSGVIPHRSIWPRLLYHRHFMLTESLGYVASISESQELASASPSEPGELTSGPMPDPNEAQPPAPRGLLRDWYQSYARRILKRYDGERVRLTRVVHYLPEIEWMQDAIARGRPLTLDEPQSYAEFPVGTFTHVAGLSAGSPSDPAVELSGASDGKPTGARFVQRDHSRGEMP